jgi:hypothetical protein
LNRLAKVAYSIWPAAKDSKIMAIPDDGKHKEYSRYATHCLDMVTVAKDQEMRAVQREMAAEWLKLADAVLHPLKRMT